MNDNDNTNDNTYFLLLRLLGGLYEDDMQLCEFASPREWVQPKFGNETKAV